MESLNCNSCGAPLQIPTTTNYVRCDHCQTNLRVQRSDGATFTEAVDRLAETTEDLAVQVNRLSRQNELNALDSEWERERESYMMSGKHGRRYLPTEASTGGTLFGIVAAVLWTVFASVLTSGAPDFMPFSIFKFVFPAFGVFIVVSLIFSLANNQRRAAQYVEAEDRYLRKRKALQETANQNVV